MKVLFRFSTVLFIVLLFVTNNSLAQSRVADDESKKEAERLWELAIAAKGGRERLESINSMLFSGENPLYRFGVRVRRNRSPKWVELLIFPNKYWTWNDYRPSIFDLLIHMKNYDTNMYYTDGGGNAPEGLQPMTVEKDGRVWMKKQYLEKPQIVYFMETKWVKPIPVKVSKGYLHKKWLKVVEPTDWKKRKNSVYIVQTEALDGRVDFALDPETYLPRRIGFYMRWYANSSNGNDEQTNTQEVYNVVDIPKYVEVNGIKFPYFGEDYEFKLNVEYDEKIFSVPTTIADGHEAWKLKK